MSFDLILGPTSLSKRLCEVTITCADQSVHTSYDRADSILGK